MFTARTITEPLKALTHDEIRLVIATYLLGQMIETGGLKADKVRAAFEYADMLLDFNLTETEKG